MDTSREETGRQSLESAQSKGEEDFRAIFSQAAVGIAQVGLDGNWLLVNNRFCEMLGYSEAELLTKTWQDVAHPDDRDKALAGRLKLLAGQITSHSMEKRYIRKDRTVLWGKLYRSLVRDHENRPRYLIAVLEDISEKIQAECALRENEQRLALAMRAAQLGVWDCSLMKDEVVLSPKYREVYHHDPLTRAEWLALVHPDDRQQVVAVARDSLAGRHQWDAEFRVLLPDGGIRWMHSYATILVDEAGQPVRMVGVSQDVTGRKQGEASLRESEERFRSLFENATVGIYRTTPGGRIEMANPALVRMLGYESFEALARRNLEEAGFEPAYPRSAFREKLEQQGEIQGLEAAWTRQDGSSLFIRESARCVRDEAGEVRWYEGIVEDATERKQMEDALRRSEEKFATAFRFGPAAQAIADLEDDGRILDVNEGFEELSGYSRRELIGRTSLEVGLWANPEHLTQALKRFEADGRVRDSEIRFRRKDGEIRTGLFSAEPMEIESRRCVITSTLDITERRQAEADREKLWAQLAQAQKMESIGRLAGGIAHDFNNLMSVIVLHALSALDELRNGESAVDSVTAIRETADKAVVLGRQLMAFSSKQLLQPEVLDLNSVVADCQKLLRRLIGEDINITLKPGSGLGLVRANRGHLGQILMNLAVNSRDAMPEGGTLTIETANIEFSQASAQPKPATEGGSYVMLAVGDTGIGMDEETQAQVFEPFFTTKGIGKGTGLGLSVVYGIVKQSGGFITVDSKPGHGAKFTIYLPVVREITRPVLDDEEGLILGGSETILLVEDEPALRTKIHDILESAGYHVLAAPDGHQAFRLALRDVQPIDLLLTDMVMPKMSGPRLAERLRTLRPYTKVLYISGYPGAGAGVTELQSLSNFIQKPFTKDTLLRRVRMVLDDNIL